MTDESDFTPGNASESQVSLAQALLAPLDAIFKAQIHAARSFLNLLLQIGYRHNSVNEDGTTKIEDGRPYQQEFHYSAVGSDGKTETRRVCVPTLALVPVAPLAVDSATFNLALRIERVEKNTQMQASENKKLARESGATDFNSQNRPWFLVSDPVSLKGTFRPTNAGSESTSSQQSTINIEVKLTRVPMPAGLDKLLTALTQSTSVANEDKG